jgi:hypothetical protein
MSDYYFCKPIFRLDKFGWDLVVEELELGQTCPTIVSGIQSETRICLFFWELWFVDRF